MLGAGEPAAPSILHSAALNWDAIGALFVIGVGLLSGNWFVVNMAMLSIAGKSEVQMRAEFADQQTGYVPRSECRIMHSEIGRRIERIEDSMEQRA